MIGGIWSRWCWAGCRNHHRTLHCLSSCFCPAGSTNYSSLHSHLLGKGSLQVAMIENSSAARLQAGFCLVLLARRKKSPAFRLIAAAEFSIIATCQLVWLMRKWIEKAGREARDWWHRKQRPMARKWWVVCGVGRVEAARISCLTCNPLSQQQRLSSLSIGWRLERQTL